MCLAPRRLVNLVEPNADVVVERVSQACTALTDGQPAASHRADRHLGRRHAAADGEADPDTGSMPRVSAPGRAKLSYRSPRSQTRKMLEQRSG